MIGFSFNNNQCEEIENFLYLRGLGIFPSNIGNKAFDGGKICSFDNIFLDKNFLYIYIFFLHIKHGKLVHSHVSDFSHGSDISLHIEQV